MKPRKKLKTASAEEGEQLAARLKQAEQVVKGAEEYLAERGDEPPVTRFFVLGRYRQRQERTSPHGMTVDIVNRKTGKSLHVDHKQKVVTVFTKQTVIDRKGNRTESEIREEPDLTVDFYNKIREVPKNAKKLPTTKTINGRKHVGFEHAQIDGPYTWTRTFWVDAETKLPSQIDVRARSDDKFYAPSDCVLENIEFDIPLDESLFSTEIPKGYTVKKSGLMSLE